MTQPLPIWSDIPNNEKVDLLRVFLAQGKSGLQIAQQFEGASRSAVIAFCRKNGLKLRGAERRVEQARAAAAKSGKPVWHDTPVAKRVQMVRQNIAKGFAASRIATLFEGVGTSAVYQFCKDHKIAMSGRPSFRRAQPSAAPDLPRHRHRHRHETGRMTYNEALAAKACKWPTWDKFEGPDVSLCCGLERVGSGPYCEEHTRRAAGRLSDLEEDTSDNA